FDVVGRIAVIAATLTFIEQVEEAVETYGRAPQRTEVVGSHSQVLLRASWIRADAGHRMRRRPSPLRVPLGHPGPQAKPRSREKIRFGNFEFQESRGNFFAEA